MAVYLACWLALDVASSVFRVVPNVSIWSPQEGLDFILLFVFGLRYWPVLLLNTPLHAYFISGSSLALWEVAFFDVTEAVIYAGAAALLVLGLKIDRSLGRQQDVVWFVGVACLAAPLLVALVEPTMLTAFAGLDPENLLRNVVSWWAGDATGIAMTAPFALAVLGRFGRIWDHPPTEAAAKAALPSRAELPEFTVQMAVMVLALLAAYGFRLPGLLEYSYFAFVPLMWIAVSSGFVRTTFAIVVANVGAVLLVDTSPTDQVEIPLQFSLMTLTIVGLLIGGIVTERNRMSEQLRQDSLHDSLTGLPNRRHFLQRLREAIGRASEKPGSGFAVLLLDLDRFKEINASRGHPSGDLLLEAVAERLSSSLPPGDMVARLGGDEFVVLAAGAGREDAARLAERLLETFREPYSLKDTRVYTSASVGIVPGEGSSGDTAGILRDADLALRRAKTSLQTNQAFFDQELRDRAEDLFELEADLRRAISEEGLSQGLAQDPSGVMPEELYLEYQPMYETDGGRPVGAEALVRWRHPRRGSIPPDRFIPMAEDTGLVVELGRLILHRACHQMRSWRQGGHELRRISVNVSPVQLERPRFVEDVLEAIQESGIEARHLQLEFTEYQRINTPEVAETLRRLADAGVSMCIDDFGTGYSSLDYLGKLPLRGLKIDRSFVQPLPEQAGGRNRNIVEAILALSDKMGLEVTAEGVETREQLDYLRSRGCGFVQGYLFSKPKPAEEVFPTD